MVHETLELYLYEVNPILAFPRDGKKVYMYWSATNGSGGACPLGSMEDKVSKIVGNLVKELSDHIPKDARMLIWNGSPDMIKGKIINASPSEVFHSPFTYSLFNETYSSIIEALRQHHSNFSFELGN